MIEKRQFINAAAVCKQVGKYLEVVEYYINVAAKKFDTDKALEYLQPAKKLAVSKDLQVDFNDPYQKLIERIISQGDAEMRTSHGFHGEDGNYYYWRAINTYAHAANLVQKIGLISHAIALYENKVHDSINKIQILVLWSP